MFNNTFKELGKMEVTVSQMQDTTDKLIELAQAKKDKALKTERKIKIVLLVLCGLVILAGVL